MIALDARYPGIVDAAEEAIQATMPGIATRRYLPKDNVVRVRRVESVAGATCSRSTDPAGSTCAPIELERVAAWISRARYPRELLRGLIHSDGCRTINRFKTKLPSGRVAAYEYPRYFFSNLSRGHPARSSASTASCSAFAWTQSNPRNISVSHRKSVALMDEFIGPKW